MVAKLAAALHHLPVTEVSHVGSTSVPGLIAKDVIDVQVGVRRLADADAEDFRAAMRGAGYLLVPGNVQDHPHPGGAGPEGWAKRFYGGCDPADIVHVHVRQSHSAGWRFALLFRDWLIHDTSERERYAVEKRRLLDLHREEKAFQGHHTVALTVERTRTEAVAEAGTVLVPLAEPLGHLAAFLLEPESPDGVATWNLLDEALSRLVPGAPDAWLPIRRVLRV